MGAVAAAVERFLLNTRITSSNAKSRIDAASGVIFNTSLTGRIVKVMVIAAWGKPVRSNSDHDRKHNKKHNWKACICATCFSAFNLIEKFMVLRKC